MAHRVWIIIIGLGKFHIKILEISHELDKFSLLSHCDLTRACSEYSRMHSKTLMNDLNNTLT